MVFSCRDEAVSVSKLQSGSCGPESLTNLPSGSLQEAGQNKGPTRRVKTDLFHSSPQDFTVLIGRSHSNHGNCQETQWINILLIYSFPVFGCRLSVQLHVRENGRRLLILSVFGFHVSGAAIPGALTECALAGMSLKHVKSRKSLWSKWARSQWEIISRHVVHIISSVWMKRWLWSLCWDHASFCEMDLWICLISCLRAFMHLNAHNRTEILKWATKWWMDRSTVSESTRFRSVRSQAGKTKQCVCACVRAWNMVADLR